MSFVGPIPVQNQDQDHRLLEGRESWGEEVVEHPLHIQFSFGGLLGTVAEESQLKFRRVSSSSPQPPPPGERMLTMSYS